VCVFVYVDILIYACMHGFMYFHTHRRFPVPSAIV